MSIISWLLRKWWINSDYYINTILPKSERISQWFYDINPVIAWLILLPIILIPFILNFASVISMPFKEPEENKQKF
jgi:hypothetical protein